MGSLILSTHDNGRNGSSPLLPVHSSRGTAANGNKPNGFAAARPAVPPASASSAPQLLLGTAGDHYAIHQLLLGVFQAPSPTEFQAQLDEPLYEPNQRVLVKHGNRASHLRLVPRVMQFGSTIVPVCGVTELATLSECRGLGYASALIGAAEQQMRTDGAELGLVRTTAPQLFEKHGWVAWGRHSFSTVGTREVLAQLCLQDRPRATPLGLGMNEGKREPLSTRIWRHVELAALTRLYEAHSRNSYGSVVRSDSYWQWLISRHGYDQIYVVVEGRDRLDLDKSCLVGYAVTKQDRIVEMMIDPTRPYATAPLLSRICGDFIERDIHSLRFDGPPHDPMHRLFVAAGGEFRHREIENQQWLMAKVFDQKRIFDRLAPQILERARMADVALPFELGVSCGSAKWQLSVSNERVALADGKLGRHYLTCGPADFTQLLLGHLCLVGAAAEGRIKFSTKTAAEFTATLFPNLPLWRPPFDELPA